MMISSFFKKYFVRLLMTVFGVALCSLSVGFFKCSVFGVDPFQCFSMGTWGMFFASTAYGTYYSFLNLALLVIVFFLDRHYIGLGTIINLFLTGYIVSFSSSVIRNLVPSPTLPVRILFLAVGIVIMCFAASLYMTSDLGVSTYDAIPIIISGKTGRQFRFVRILCDLVCVLIGTVCVLTGAADGQMPGAGTIITALFMGPLVDFFNRHFSEPFLKAVSGK